MRLPNAGIERLETTAPETWRPPARSLDPGRSSADAETLPPPARASPETTQPGSSTCRVGRAPGLTAATTEGTDPALGLSTNVIADRTRKTARPPIRRLHDTERPARRRSGGDGTRSPVPSAGSTLPARPATEARRLASRPGLAGPITSKRRAAAGPAAAAARPLPAPPCDQTTCAGCRAVTPTRRPSTLGSIGWRLGSVTGRAPEREPRWFCPKCRERGKEAQGDTPAAARKA
jgi:hypothetical protein